MQQKEFRIAPLRLRPASAAVSLLFATSAAWAAGDDADTNATQGTDVEFDSALLQQTGGAHIDASRFSRGNVALPGTYQSDLYVNGSLLGRAAIQIRDVRPNSNDIQACFDLALIERIGIDLQKLSPDAIDRLAHDGDACITLPSLVTDATARFDNGEQRLDMSVPQIAMKRDARGYVDPRYWDDGVTAARLQYNANLYYSDSYGVGSTQSYVGLSTGINVGSWRFNHNGSLTSSSQAGTHYQSIATDLQRAIAPLKSQLTIGDAFTDGAVFDSVGFRGVQLASDDRMYPESQRGYAPIVRGIAHSQARVQVRQNGNLLYETTVAPGAFEIDDLYPTGYGGNLDVTVIEADGRVHTSTVPFASAVNALRPGITRFGATVGQYRNATTDSHPLMFQGTVQHGFTNLITGYGGFVASPGYVAVQMGAALNTKFGAFGLDITQAATQLEHVANRNGQSLRLSYSKLVEPTNTNVSVAAYRYSSHGYLDFADAVALRDLDRRNLDAEEGEIQRGRIQITVNQSLPEGSGSFYVSGSTQNYWNHNGSDTQLQAGYNNYYKNLNYSLAIARQLDTGTKRWDNRVMLTLSIPLGSGAHRPNTTTSLQTGGSSSPTTATQTMTGTLGVDNALSYGVNAGYSGGNGMASSTTAGANVAYSSPVMLMSASVSRSATYTQANVGMSGGVVAYSGGVALTPMMGDTLAIVEAKGASGARITSGSGLRVDPWGHAIVSSLTPFSSNEIDIDPKGLPINVEMDSTQQTVAPTAGAIVKLKFKTDYKGRAAILALKTDDGAPVPFGADVTDAQGDNVGTVAQEGRVIARGLKTDTGKLFVEWGSLASEHCSVRYVLSAADEGKETTYSVVGAMCR